MALPPPSGRGRCRAAAGRTVPPSPAALGRTPSARIAVVRAVPVGHHEAHRSGQGISSTVGRTAGSDAVAANQGGEASPFAVGRDRRGHPRAAGGFSHRKGIVMNRVSVAQVCNLLYRRLAVGEACIRSSCLETVRTLRIGNTRYGRLQVCVTVHGPIAHSTASCRFP